MKRKILFDTSFFHAYFGGVQGKAKEVMNEIFAGKSLGYTLDLVIAEFIYTYGRVKGIEEAKVKVSLIMNSPIKVVSTTKEIALRAGELKIKYRDLSLVDCFVIALAEREGAVIYTTDSGIGKAYKNTVVLPH